MKTKPYREFWILKNEDGDIVRSESIAKEIKSHQDLILTVIEFHHFDAKSKALDAANAEIENLRATLGEISEHILLDSGDQRIKTSEECKYLARQALKQSKERYR
jgi:hypothetical protein